jgi:GGDEF domain-containing protein
MESGPFYEDDSNVLTPGAFGFALDNELKRAVRYQHFLTLVVVTASRGADGQTRVDDSTAREVATIIGREVRDSDMIAHTGEGVLSLVLLDADYDHSARVVDRLLARIGNYAFPDTLQITVGAACYPTHAVDATSLKRQAMTHSIMDWRGGIRRAADQN